MPMENSERTTARNTVKALSELTLRPKRPGRGTGTEPSKPKTADHGKNTCRERTKLAGASGAWRRGAPRRIRCMGSTGRAMNRMTEGTERVSRPWKGADAQILLLGR